MGMKNSGINRRDGKLRGRRFSIESLTPAQEYAIGRCVKKRDAPPCDTLTSSKSGTRNARARFECLKFLHILFAEERTMERREERNCRIVGGVKIPPPPSPSVNGLIRPLGSVARHVQRQNGRRRIFAAR